MIDFDQHVLTLTMHFLRRGYPMKLLEEAATLARSKDRMYLIFPDQILDGSVAPINSSNTDKVFLITTFHPTDHAL